MAKFGRSKPETLSKVLTMRVSSAEHQAIREAAAANGWTIAELMRDALDVWMKNRKRRKEDGR